MWYRCNRCHNLTRHDILAEQKEENSEEVAEFTFLNSITQYKIVKCAGCEDISFVYQYHGDDDPEGTTIQYPKRTIRKLPVYLSKLIWNSVSGKTDIHGMMTEIYGAYMDGSYRLCAMGIRSLSELIMVEQVGDHLSFKANIERFYEERHINKNQKEKLIQLIDVGSAVIHRAAKPDKEIVDEMLDVLENIVESLYISKEELHRAFEKFKRK